MGIIKLLYCIVLIVLVHTRLEYIVLTNTHVRIVVERRTVYFTQLGNLRY